MSIVFTAMAVVLGVTGIVFGLLFKLFVVVLLSSVMVVFGCLWVFSVSWAYGQKSKDSGQYSRE